MRIEEGIKIGFRDVLIRPKRSTLKSRAEVELDRGFEWKYSGRPWNGVPIVAANMDTVGTFSMARVLAEHSMITAIHKHYSLDAWEEFLSGFKEELSDFLWVSTGTSSEDFEKLNELLVRHSRLKTICIDVANGYSEAFVDAVKRTRDRWPEHGIVAGNVVTGEMVEELILAGADCIKVGIGPGSVCTTRVKTGVGYPQLSAIIECADAAHGLGGMIVGDGGCTCPGDVAKAFGGGADFVMLGGMFSGHDEGETEVVEEDGKRFVRFYGMSSAEAMQRYAGGVANYRASEGKAVLRPYRGPVEATLLDILGGLRSTCTYVGAARLKELSKRTTFVRVQEQENQVFNSN